MFTSVPMPKQKMRVCPAFCSFTFLKMLRSSVTPMVGRPSVRKMMVGVRAAPATRAGKSASALRSASSIAVLPSGFNPFRKSIARLRFSGLAVSTSPKSGSTSVEKRSTSKRSLSLRFSTQKASAFFACSSLPPAIEPDVSITKHTSLGTDLPFATAASGEASRRK